MKYLFLLLFFIGTANAQGPKVKCPRNFDGKTISALKTDIKKRKGEVLAFDGEVLVIEKGYNTRPYFKVKLESGDTMWIASMIVGNHISLARKIRILGYLDEVATDDEIGLKYNSDGIQVRAFAYLDLDTKNLQIADQFMGEATQWLSGVLPKKLE